MLASNFPSLCPKTTYHGINESDGLKGKVNTEARHFNYYLLNRLLEVPRVEKICDS